jgi:8-oxo-dGTP diphosphatase
MKGLARVAFKVAARLRIAYWFVFRPQTQGVKCVVEHDGRWLMIRNSYGKGHWTFPGGAIARNEARDAAAIREVREEVGVALQNVRSIGSYESNLQYKHDTVHCFVAHVTTPVHQIDNVEVIESAWVSPNELPLFRSKAVDKINDLLAQPRRSDAEANPRRSDAEANPRRSDAEAQ